MIDDVEAVDEVVEVVAEPNVAAYAPTAMMITTMTTIIAMTDDFKVDEARAICAYKNLSQAFTSPQLTLQICVRVLVPCPDIQSIPLVLDTFF